MKAIRDTRVVIDGNTYNLLGHSMPKSIVQINKNNEPKNEPKNNNNSLSTTKILVVIIVFIGVVFGITKL